MNYMYQGVSAGAFSRPEWSVLVSTAPKGDDTAVSADANNDMLLAADEVYTFTADTDVLVTITPATNYPVNVKLSYTGADGVTQEFQVSGLTGGPITATVRGKVLIDAEMAETGFTSQMPVTYAVHMPKPTDGVAYRDHNMAAPGDVVTFAVLPDEGKTLDGVNVVTVTGEAVPYHYEGISTKNYYVFTFVMPEDTVNIALTLKTAESVPSK